jgi:hypothetical protein
MTHTLFLAVAAMAALFASRATADEISDLVATYNSSWERGITVWHQLYQIDGKRWRAAILMKQACGEDAPDGLLLSKEEEGKKIVYLNGLLYPDTDDDMLFRTLVAVNSAIQGYRWGYQEGIAHALTLDRRTLCKVGRDLAGEVLLEDARPPSAGMK